MKMGVGGKVRGTWEAEEKVFIFYFLFFGCYI